MNLRTTAVVQEEEMIENAKQVLTSMGEKLTKSEARRFGAFSYKMKCYLTPSDLYVSFHEYSMEHKNFIKFYLPGVKSEHYLLLDIILYSFRYF